MDRYETVARLLREAYVQQQFVCRQFRFQILSGRRDGIDQVKNIMPDDQRASLDARHFDQIIEHPAQTPRFGNESPAFGRSTMFRRQGIGRRNHGRQRGLEIVSDGRDQRRAQVVTLLERAPLVSLCFQLDALMRQSRLAEKRYKKGLHLAQSGNANAAKIVDTLIQNGINIKTASNR